MFTFVDNVIQTGSSMFIFYSVGECLLNWPAGAVESKRGMFLKRILYIIWGL